MFKDHSFTRSRSVSYQNIAVSSPAFKTGDTIPVMYTCDGVNQNPPLHFQHLPVDTQTIAIIMDDPDAPAGTGVHWVVWNIPLTHQLRENYGGGINGLNDFGRAFYCGPCPQGGTHRYFFKIYALDCILDLPAGAKKRDLEKAMSGHILAFGELIANYKKS